MEHMLKLVLAQSTATLGAVMRTWLWVMGAPAVLSFMVMYHDLKPVHGSIEAVARALPACLIIGCLVSIPVMAVLAVIHIARKW